MLALRRVVFVWCPVALVCHEGDAVYEQASGLRPLGGSNLQSVVRGHGNALDAARPTSMHTCMLVSSGGMASSSVGVAQSSAAVVPGSIRMASSSFHGHEAISATRGSM